jgi:DNA-binding MarR family transcriptional regulator
VPAERSEAVSTSPNRSGPGQPLADHELAAWRGLLRTSARLRRELGERMTRDTALTLADYDILLALAGAERHRMRMAELADVSLQPRSSLTRLVGDLERRGYVQRERTAEDGRGAEAVLTAEGRKTLRAAHRRHLDNVRELFLDDLSDRQLRELAAVWRRLGIDP